MLAIRMQRTGRKGHAMFRLVVQDSRRTPTSGKIVAQLGSYDPHGKALIVNKEKASFYLEHGAQPSSRVAQLLKSDGVKLPDWVTPPVTKARAVRHADKRRSTRPPEPVAEVAEVEEPVVPAAEAATETPAETEVTPEAEPVAEVGATPDETPADPAETA